MTQGDVRHEALESTRAAARAAGLPEAVQRAFPASVGTGDVDAAIDRIIMAIDDAVASVVDRVLHAPAYQRLEAAWRGLAYVVDNVDFRENTELALWTCTKDELARDLGEASELTRTASFAHIYTAEYGQFGGAPYAAILADMAFDASPGDIALLRGMASLAAMAHAPFFAAASPSLFRVDDWRAFARLRDPASDDESPRLVAWNAFRDEDDSRYVGLLLPRFLLRRPFARNDAGGSFACGYEEGVGADGKELLWGNPVYAFALRLAASFARDRTLTGLMGPEQAPPAPALDYGAALGERVARPPVEILVTPRIELQLREFGLIALLHTRDSGRLFVASANSLQRAKEFGRNAEGRDATLNYRLGTKFAYLMLACRIAHYIKVIQRETVGTPESVEDVEQSLNEWIGNYVVDMDSASTDVRARYPLRRAEVKVQEVPETPGWYRAEISIRPHLKYLGTAFTLSVSSLLERRAR